jgi:hypothetical protein
LIQINPDREQQMAYCRMSSSVSATSAAAPPACGEEILPAALLLAVLLRCDALLADNTSR